MLRVRGPRQPGAQPCPWQQGGIQPPAQVPASLVPPVPEPHPAGAGQRAALLATAAARGSDPKPASPRPPKQLLLCGSCRDTELPEPDITLSQQVSLAISVRTPREELALTLCEARICLQVSDVLPEVRKVPPQLYASQIPSWQGKEKVTQELFHCK